MEGPTAEHRHPDRSFWERVDRWLSDLGPLGLRNEDWLFVAALLVIAATLIAIVLIVGGTPEPSH